MGLRTMSTSSELRVSRRRPLPAEETRQRPRTLGELRWLSAVSRPDTRARVARLASRMKSLEGRDAYGRYGLFKTIESRQALTSLKYSSGPCLRTLTLAAWSDTAYSGKGRESPCSLGLRTAFLPSSLGGTRRVFHGSSRFTRRTLTGSIGGEVCAFSEMVDHAGTSMEFPPPFWT